MKVEKNSGQGRFVILYLLITVLFAGLTLLLLFSGKYLLPKILPKQEKGTLVGDINYGVSSVCILIDAGHGGEDGGAIGVDGTLEKTVNLKIAERVYGLCRIAGIPASMTRTDDRLLYDPNTDYQGKKKMLDLRTRLKMAEETSGSVLVSIHLNSFSQSQYSGLQVYYSPNNPLSARLAEKVQTNTQRLLQADNTREIKAADSAIYLLNRCTRPAVLIECGFLSNPDECQKFGDEGYLRELAAVIFSGILDYLEAEVSGT